MGRMLYHHAFQIVAKSQSWQFVGVQYTFGASAFEQVESLEFKILKASFFCIRFWGVVFLACEFFVFVLRSFGLYTHIQDCLSQIPVIVLG